jgi:uncharacterized protein YjbJ (UPF0337 family)
MINTQELQGQWNKIRGKVKERWGNLTDDDLQVQGGNFDQMVGRIQQRTGEGREMIEKFLNDLTSRGASAVSQAAESVNEYMQGAGEQVREQVGHVTRRMNEGYEHSKEMVQNNPAQSLAVAFGVGSILGLVVGLALRSK